MRSSMLVASLVLLNAAPGLADDLLFKGTCDGSAAALLDNGLVAVADDEDNTIRIYDRGGGEPVRHSDLSGVAARPEPDFEGAARIGDRIYWIGSHSRNSRGEVEVSRSVIVATDLDGRMVGAAYRGLLDSLADADRSEKIGLVDSIGKADRSRARAAEAGGLNIEGLAAKPDGSAWIGLRNPRSDDGDAVLIPIEKLDSVGTARAEVVPRKAVKLSIDELGIRDMAWSTKLDAFLVIGGTSSAGDDFRLYRWAGDDSSRSAGRAHQRPRAGGRPAAPRRPQRPAPERRGRPPRHGGRGWLQVRMAERHLWLQAS